MVRSDRCLTDAFHPVSVNLHQFVRLQQAFDLRPHSGQQGMKIPLAQIAKAQMHDPGRGCGNDDAVGEIRILGHNGKVFALGVLPQRAVGGAGAEPGDRDDRQRGSEAQPAGQILVEQEALHATGTTE